MNERRLAADRFADRIHAGQVRKGQGRPFIVHPRAVAALVEAHGGHEDEIIAALLHDVIEDSDGNVGRRELAEDFGERVAVIVAGCTDTAPAREPGEAKEPWLVRKARSLTELVEMDEGTAMVKAADLLHNVGDCLVDLQERGPELWWIFLEPSDFDRDERRDRVLAYWLAVLAGLRALRHRRLAALLDRLEDTLADLERQARGTASYARGQRCALCQNELAALARHWRLEDLRGRTDDDSRPHCSACGREHAPLRRAANATA